MPFSSPRQCCRGLLQVKERYKLEDEPIYEDDREMPANFHESCAATYHRLPPECLPQVWLSISLVFFRINANGDGNVVALAPHFKVKFDVSKPARLSRAPSNLSGVSMNTFGVRILE